MDLLDDHIHAGMNFYATTQEIVREWQAMGEDTLEFEAAKKELAEERETFNSEKKGLLWRVAEAEDKLAKEKQFNVDQQKEWETACEWTNREMKSARDETVRLKVSADCKWLLARDVPLIADRIVKSDELAKYMFELGEAAYDSGRKEGYGEGRAAVAANEKVDHFDLYKTDCSAQYVFKRREYEFLEFGIVRAVEKLSRKGGAIEILKKALGDQDPKAGDAGPSPQV
ncbi:hypothetical protein HanPI659440_Chr07g0257471 [Helianthus annuus]|nr:hypothetical protein HanPI659440_Chr07g0257471 [Helianthus annuus]